MDLSVNKSAKEAMRNRFREWYASEVLKQKEDGVEMIAPIDLKRSTLNRLALAG